MDAKLKNALWIILAIDVMVVMCAIMYYMPKPPVM